MLLKNSQAERKEDLIITMAEDTYNFFCVDCMRARLAHWFSKTPLDEKKIVCDECLEGTKPENGTDLFNNEGC
jgi:hypothetical protein